MSIKGIYGVLSDSFIVPHCRDSCVFVFCVWNSRSGNLHGFHLHCVLLNNSSAIYLSIGSGFNLLYQG